MPTGYTNSAGTDFENLFDPDIGGDGPVAEIFENSSNVLLKFADIKYGSKGPDVGYELSNGFDVSTLWAAKGSAKYTTPDNGTGYSSSDTITIGGGGSTSISLYMRQGQYYVNTFFNNNLTQHGPFDIPAGVTQFYTKLVENSASGDYTQTLAHDSVWTNLSALSATTYTEMVTATASVPDGVEGQTSQATATLTLDFGNAGSALFTGTNGWTITVRNTA